VSIYLARRVFVFVWCYFQTAFFSSHHFSTILAIMAHPSKAATLAEKYGLLEHQTRHRLRILEKFNIPINSEVLEIGCGQGDMTAVLASTLAESHIDAIDPAPLDYGKPETLGQAQARMSSHDIGAQISFNQADPISWLKKKEHGTYDAAVLCHCLWYFASIDEVRNVFAAAKGKVKRLCVAEWALQAQATQGQTHVLTALARATCESHIPNSTQNIRTPLHPAQLKKIAEEVGWKESGEETWAPGAGLEDAKWEVNMLLKDDGRDFLERARGAIAEERVHVLLESMLDAVKRAKTREEHESGELQCMDIWVGVFE
jgi:SAM-dependent methyltransferase